MVDLPHWWRAGPSAPAAKIETKRNRDMQTGSGRPLKSVTGQPDRPDWLDLDLAYWRSDGNPDGSCDVADETGSSSYLSAWSALGSPLVKDQAWSSPSLLRMSGTPLARRVGEVDLPGRPRSFSLTTSPASHTLVLRSPNSNMVSASCSWSPPFLLGASVYLALSHTLQH